MAQAVSSIVVMVPMNSWDQEKSRKGKKHAIIEKMEHDASRITPVHKSRTAHVSLYWKRVHVHFLELLRQQLGGHVIL